MCKGKKTVTEHKDLEVNIDKGMEDGQKITFMGEADQVCGCGVVIDDKIALW